MIVGPISVALALSGREWRSSLQRHCRDYVADIAVQLVRDGRQALDPSISVVVLDDDTSWLSTPFLNAARERGIPVIGLYDPLESDGHGQRHLQRLGVDAVLSAAISTEQLLEGIRDLTPNVETFDRFIEAIEGVDDRIRQSKRQIVAVGGPAGAGATEVSIGFLQTAPGARGILIDVDETHPSIARRLGLAIHPHIVTAIESLRRERIRPDGTQRTELEDCLAIPALNNSLPFDVITGLASRDDWTLLRADDVVDLVTELTARWPVVVARVGPQLEDLTRWADRYEVSRSVVRNSTRIIGVCEATSLGVLRFVDWLVDVVGLVDETPIDVVLNRVPKSPAARSELVTQIREIAGDRIGEIVCVAEDKRVKRASWDAKIVTKGQFVKNLARLHQLKTGSPGEAQEPQSRVSDLAPEYESGALL